MREDKNKIFESLADKLDEKEFQFNSSHWESVDKLIPKQTGSAFWSIKTISATIGVIATAGIITYSSLQTEEDPIIDNVDSKVVVLDNSTSNTKSEESNNQSEKIDIAEEEVKKIESTYKLNPRESVPEENSQVMESPINSNEEITTSKINKEEEPLTALNEDEYNEYIKLTENDFRNRTKHNDDINSQTVDKTNEKAVEIKEEDITVPNIFTPNNDGTNDLFVIENINLSEEWQLFIFDKNNNLVFQSSDYDNSWNGNDLNTGSYMYKLYNEKYNVEKEGVFKLER